MTREEPHPADTNSENRTRASVSLDGIDDTDQAVPPRKVVDIHGNTAPVLLKHIPMRDIEIENKTYQFRLGTGYPGLAESIEKDGQHEPIKVMAGENGYVILDGFCRTGDLVEQGAEYVHALVYPMLTEKEAWKIALNSNLKRKNLTSKDKANAIQRARKEGMTRRSGRSLVSSPARCGATSTSPRGSLSTSTEGWSRSRTVRCCGMCTIR